jgi:hypothetical protein
MEGLFASRKKMILVAGIFTALGVITAIPMQAMLALLVMATDSCTNVSTLSELLWAAATFSFLPLLAASVVGVWFAVYRRSMRLVLAAGFLPTISFICGVLFVISIFALGC